MKIALSNILPSPEPVRTQMEPAKLDELAQSIKEQGLIVPIKVRPANVQTESWVRRVEEAGTDWQRVLGVKDSRPQNEQYEIVYGHRRFAASKMAGLEEIEAIVEGAGDDDALIQALIENVQREDMNDADVRDALREIKQRTEKEWKEIGAMFGWGKSHTRELANMQDDEIEILRTHRDVVSKRHVIKSREAGHDSTKVLEKAAKEKLSGEQTARVAKSVNATKDPKRKQHLIDTPYSPYTHDPEWNKERARKYGASDPTSFDDGKTKTDEWRELPETKAVFDYLKESKEYAGKVYVMFKDGKFAPEAKLFTISKIKSMLQAWEDTIEGLEE